MLSEKTSDTQFSQIFKAYFEQFYEHDRLLLLFQPTHNSVIYFYCSLQSNSFFMTFKISRIFRFVLFLN